MNNSPAGAADTQEAARETPGGNPNWVTIVNPAPHLSANIKASTAQRWIKTRRAVAAGPGKIELVKTNLRNEAAAEKAEQKAYNSSTAAGYDEAAAVIVKSWDEVRNLPAMEPEILLTNRSVRRTKFFKGRNGPVRVVQQFDGAPAA